MNNSALTTESPDKSPKVSPAAWMIQCLALAEKALPKDVPVGALVIHDGEIVGEGFNTRERDCTPLGHAELNAIAQASQTLNRWRLNDCTLVVTLEPCPMCASAIAQARIQTIYFGAYDPIQGACGSRHTLLSPDQTVVQGGILEAECQKQLQGFFQARR